MSKSERGKAKSVGVYIFTDFFLVIILTVLSCFVDKEGIIYSPLSVFLITLGVVLFSYAHFFIVGTVAYYILQKKK